MLRFFLETFCLKKKIDLDQKKNLFRNLMAEIQKFKFMKFSRKSEEILKKDRRRTKINRFY